MVLTGVRCRPTRCSHRKMPACIHNSVWACGAMSCTPLQPAVRHPATTPPSMLHSLLVSGACITHTCSAKARAGLVLLALVLLPATCWWPHPDTMLCLLLCLLGHTRQAHRHPRGDVKGHRLEEQGRSTPRLSAASVTKGQHHCLGWCHSDTLRCLTILLGFTKSCRVAWTPLASCMGGASLLWNATGGHSTRLPGMACVCWACPCAMLPGPTKERRPPAHKHEALPPFSSLQHVPTSNPPASACYFHPHAPHTAWRPPCTQHSAALPKVTPTCDGEAGQESSLTPGLDMPSGIEAAQAVRVPHPCAAPAAIQCCAGSTRALTARPKHVACITRVHSWCRGRHTRCHWGGEGVPPCGPGGALHRQVQVSAGINCMGAGSA